MESDENLANASEVASGTFWGLLGSGATKIIAFVYTIYIARAVAQNDVGLFYFALSILGLVGACRSLGLPASLVRYIPFYESRGENGKVKSLLKWSYAVNIISGALFTAAVWFGADMAGAFFSNPGLPDAMRFLAAYMLLDNLLGLNTFFLQGKSDIKGMQATNTLQNVLKLALTAAFFTLFGATLYSVCRAFVLSYAFAILYSGWLAYKHTGRLPADQPGLKTQEILREIMPLGIMLTIIQVIWTLVSYADRVVLGYLLPSSTANDTLAVYSLAVAFALNVLVFPSTVAGIFLPTISRLVGKGDMEGVRKAMATAQRWMLFLTAPFAVVMVAFSGEMMSAFFGSAYSSGGTVMAVFSIGLVFSVFSYAIMLTLAGMRLVKVEFKVALIVMVANIALCILLIPQFGIEGAALAGAAGFALQSYLFLGYGKKLIGFSSPSGAYRMGAATVITCAALFLIKPAVASASLMIPPFGGAEMAPYVAKAGYLALLGIVTALSFLIFIVLSLLLKCFDHEDIVVMKKVARMMKMPPTLEAASEKLALMGVEKKS